MIRVLVVDDQELVRVGLHGILRTELGFDVVGECADGSEVIAAVESLTPDVVLMDVRMPLVDGVRATRDLRHRDGSPPVLALTTFDDDEVLAGMLRAGASGFVLKGIPAEDLHRAVRAVAQGDSWLDPAVTGRVLAIYRSAAPPRAGRDADLDALTGREREVLTLIGQGKANTEIAAELFVSEGTVKTHINNLFTKLQLRDRAAAIVFAFDHDLAVPVPERESPQPPPGKFDVPGSGRSAAPAVPVLIEPLTYRELQVLAMLAAGTANQAIAGELFITLDTVKKHVSHVLGKLGAANRTEAVARARDLGLIP